MARPRLVDSRYDFRDGVNSSYSEDLLSHSELRRGQNARSFLGDIEKRWGSQRIHVNTIGGGALVKGVFQWESPAGQEIVAICNAKFYHKLLADADFTEVIPGAGTPLTTTDAATFAVYRTGATNKLLIADKMFRTWDGTTLVMSIAGAPDADRTVIYKLRACGINGTKTLFLSKIGNPLLWDVTSGGISVDIETYDSTQLLGIIVIGSSLLIFKANNIARFTGVDASNIRVDVETEGISPDTGLAAVNTLVSIEEAAFFVSDRGPQLANESGIKEIGLKVSKEFDFANNAWISGAFAVHHRGRREVWLSLPPTGQAQNTRTWIYNYRTEAWSGPFIFPFNAAATARYERADGSESVFIGGYDGRIRDADVKTYGAKDDVLKDGTGGTSVTMDVELPALLGGAPDTIKSLRDKNKIEADLGAAGSLVPYWTSELNPAGSSVAVPTKGAGVHNYAYKFANAKGARIVHGLRESTSEITRILGVLPRLTFSRPGR